MDEYPIQAVISGIAGAIVAWWVTAKWAKAIPNRLDTKGANLLISENRWRIHIANALFLGVIGGGIALFKSGYIARSNWRGFGLIVGLAFVAPSAFLYLLTLNQGLGRFHEALVANAINQRLPMAVLKFLVLIGYLTILIAVVTLFR